MDVTAHSEPGHLCILICTILQRIDNILTSLQNPEDQLKDHTYLSEHYAPVSEEFTEAPVAVIEGVLPDNIDGMVCRKGPNPVTSRRLRKIYHWFDGGKLRTGIGV